MRKKNNNLIDYTRLLFQESLTENNRAESEMSDDELLELYEELEEELYEDSSPSDSPISDSNTADTKRADEESWLHEHNLFDFREKFFGPDAKAMT